MGIRDPHTHTHIYMCAHTQCYLIHVGLLNLIVVHYITDSYPRQNSTALTYREADKDSKGYFYCESIHRLWSLPLSSLKDYILAL